MSSRAIGISYVQLQCVDVSSIRMDLDTFVEIDNTLYNVCRYMSKRYSHLIEGEFSDLMQEGWEVLLALLEKDTEASKKQAYIFATVRNHFFDQFRKVQRQRAYAAHVKSDGAVPDYDPSFEYEIQLVAGHELSEVEQKLFVHLYVLDVPTDVFCKREEITRYRFDQLRDKLRSHFEPYKKSRGIDWP